MSQALMNHTQESAAATSALAAAAWTLEPGEALRMPIGPGLRELHVLQGRLWITRQGKLNAPAEDVWLGAGERVTLPSGSEWVIEGWGDTRFQLLVPPSACAIAARRLKEKLSASGASAAAWAAPSPA